MQTDPHGPLAGVRVLDASRVLAGPFCGQVLGDLGAEVIKVERPGAGDETRAWGPPFLGPLSAYYLSCNRNKRAVTLDLGQADGVHLLHELARRSDVLLENFRSGSADRLGLSADALLAVNPRLVVCSISGFGRTGPLREVPGYDFAVQALSGLMSITGPTEGPPCKVGVAVTDVLTGLYAAVAILACLNARARSGHGYTIDLALLDCAVAAQVNVAQAYLTSGTVPPRQGNAHLQIVPYQLFATAESWLVLAVGNDGQWQRFCQAAERPDLAGDSRFMTNTLRVENRGVLVPLLEPVLRARTTREWEEQLTSAGVPHAPVWDYATLFAQPQAAARGLRVTVRDPQGRPVDLIGTPFHIGGATLPSPSMPPALGEHTDEVLREVLGLDAARVEELRRAGVV
ncbi:MAG TPA: CaiB/BaiF CoA-transferase family protein [Gemmataceae bacterium]|nr:CaiB/BaiF CoA-transferase family protein [Gemmataceae bacterium]